MERARRRTPLCRWPLRRTRRSSGWSPHFDQTRENTPPGVVQASAILSPMPERASPFTAPSEPTMVTASCRFFPPFVETRALIAPEALAIQVTPTALPAAPTLTGRRRPSSSVEAPTSSRSRSARTSCHRRRCKRRAPDRCSRRPTRRRRACRHAAIDGSSTRPLLGERDGTSPAAAGVARGRTTPAARTGRNGRSCAASPTTRKPCRPTRPGPRGRRVYRPGSPGPAPTTSLPIGAVRAKTPMYGP